MDISGPHLRYLDRCVDGSQPRSLTGYLMLLFSVPVSVRAYVRGNGSAESRWSVGGLLWLAGLPPAWRDIATPDKFLVDEIYVIF